MNRILVSRYFCLDEFVPKDIYEHNSEFQVKLLIDWRLYQIADQLRLRFGPLTINNWYTGGDRQWSGFRTVTSPYFKQFSQHSYGRAMDLVSSKYTGEEMRDEIRKHYNVYKFLGVTRVEKDVSWLHVDLGYTGLDTLVEVNG